MNRLSKWLRNLCSIKTSAVVIFLWNMYRVHEDECDKYMTVISWTRKIIRYRATATLRRPQIKQWIASKEEGGTQNQREHHIIWLRIWSVAPHGYTGNKVLPWGSGEDLGNLTRVEGNSFQDLHYRWTRVWLRTKKPWNNWFIAVLFCFEGGLNSTSTYVPAQ